MKHGGRTLLFLALLWALPGFSATIRVACGGVGNELRLCHEGLARWSAQSGHKAVAVSMPHSSTERLALYLQFLSAKADDIDVFQIDTVWPGILAYHMLDLGSMIPRDRLAGFLPALLHNNTVAGRLVAIPWFTEPGLLFYRSDLLEKYNIPLPDTWPRLREAARLVLDGERAAGHPLGAGFVWQGASYEGLTCNALEWVASYGGGTIVDEAGRVTINNPAAKAALQEAASWIGTISPRGVLNMDEEKARGVFQSGGAVFMRNWPYAWAMMQSEDSPVRGKVGVGPLPHGPGYPASAATLGGWSLAVSRYSRHSQEAVDLVLFLTSTDEQRRRAIAGAFNPTIMALYKDSAVLEAQPFMGGLEAVLSTAVVRPAGITAMRYNRVSHAFWTTAYQVLTHEVSPRKALARLERQLNGFSDRGRWGRADGR